MHYVQTCVCSPCTVTHCEVELFSYEGSQARCSYFFGSKPITVVPPWLCKYIVVLQAKMGAQAAVKAEPSSSQAIKTDTSDLVSLQEMKDFLRSRGGSIPATQLTQQFKARIVVSPGPCTCCILFCPQ